MAVMFPRAPVADSSGAEKRVFGRLKEALPDPFTVIHQARFFDPNARGPSQDREADFIVAHPTLGALVIEVKGGRIRHRATARQWESVDHRDQAHSILDPFKQALDSTYSLIRYLKALPNWPNHSGAVAHAVCFPDSELVSEPTPSVRPELIIQASDLSSNVALEQRIADILGQAAKRRQPAVDGQWFDVLVQALARDVEIRPVLGIQIAEADQTIELSQRQFEVLSALAGNRRVAVRGPAGSGKTLLAVEQARRLAGSGYRVLLTCFNRMLAEHLNENNSGVEGLEIANFHRFARRLAEQAGLDVSQGDQGQRYFDETLPALTEEALRQTGPLYDAIIVDEGQDFSPAWWRCLETAMKDSDAGLFYVFYDDNQAIYGRSLELPEGFFAYRLVENWRNTKQIHEEIMKLYEGEEVVCRGPEGPAVSFRTVATGQTATALAKELRRLTEAERVDPADIVVLTPRSLRQSSVRGRIGDFMLKEHASADHEIRLASIYRFKGLDSRVVVVCEIDEKVSPDLWKLLYVAFSRARVLLVLLITANDPENALVDEADDPSPVGGSAAVTWTSEGRRAEPADGGRARASTGRLSESERGALTEYEDQLRDPEKKAFAAAIRAALDEGEEPPDEWAGLSAESSAKVRRRALRRVRRVKP